VFCCVVLCCAVWLCCVLWLCRVFDVTVPGTQTAQTRPGIPAVSAEVVAGAAHLRGFGPYVCPPPHQPWHRTFLFQRPWLGTPGASRNPEEEWTRNALRLSPLVRPKKLSRRQAADSGRRHSCSSQHKHGVWVLNPRPPLVAGPCECEKMLGDQNESSLRGLVCCHAKGLSSGEGYPWSYFVW
jgi:hypothetical protein